MRIIIGLDHICKLFTHIIVRNPRPQSDNNWDNRRGRLWYEGHMCSWSVNALIRCSIKRSTLVARSSFRPCCNRLAGQKMLCKFSLRARMTIYGTHAYGYLVLGYLSYLSASASVLSIMWFVLSICPLVHPYTYSVCILLVTAILLLLLLLLCYCYYCSIAGIALLLSLL